MHESLNKDEKRNNKRKKLKCKIRKKYLKILGCCCLFQVYFLIYNTDYRCNVSLFMKVLNKETEFRNLDILLFISSLFFDIQYRL